MSLLLGIDLGTTKTTCIAVDAESGDVVASVANPTGGHVTSSEDCKLGRSEWDVEVVLRSGFDCLIEILRTPAVDGHEVCSLGVTGQQHGMVLVDQNLKPLTPLINWQDQRGNELVPGRDVSWVQEARSRCGDGTLKKLGCRLNSGFLGTTLFWLKQQGRVPSNGRACFVMDLFVAMLTGCELQTDPSVAASGGIMNVASRDWDDDVLAALEFRREQLPIIFEADRPAGFVSRSDIHGALSGVLNIGTGAQVAVFTEGTVFTPPVELRPFPIQGNLLSNVGLTGGWSFQVVENFVRQLGVDVFGAAAGQPLYNRLTELAKLAAADSQGLRCVPTFSGTRSDPMQTGSFAGLTPSNLTPANFARSVLEGMAENYRNAFDQILEADHAALLGDDRGNHRSIDQPPDAGRSGQRTAREFRTGRCSGSTIRHSGCGNSASRRSGVWSGTRWRGCCGRLFVAR